MEEESPFRCFRQSFLMNRTEAFVAELALDTGPRLTRADMRNPDGAGATWRLKGRRLGPQHFPDLDLAHPRPNNPRARSSRVGIEPAPRIPHTVGVGNPPMRPSQSVVASRFICAHCGPLSPPITT